MCRDLDNSSSVLRNNKKQALQLKLGVDTARMYCVDLRSAEN